MVERSYIDIVIIVVICLDTAGPAVGELSLYMITLSHFSVSIHSILFIDCVI